MTSTISMGLAALDAQAPGPTGAASCVDSASLTGTTKGSVGAQSHSAMSMGSPPGSRACAARSCAVELGAACGATESAVGLGAGLAAAATAALAIASSSSNTSGIASIE